jgi:adenylate cyclase
MPREIQATIAFADVCQSTRLYEVLGDQRARSAIAECIAVMSEITRRYDGRVIKTIGDEVMVAFKSADAAATALTLMQEEITDKMSVDGFPLVVRAGFHAGTVLLEDGDVFGDAVNTAARVAGRAKPGQIMTTADTVALLSPAWRASTRQVDLSTVKGKRSPIAMYDLVRVSEDATVIQTRPRAPRENDATLRLSLGSSEVRVDPSHPSATLGRGPGNDLVVADTLASRLHARIEYRRGRFVLVDLSVNGTFVLPDGDPEPRWLRRDEVALEGEGRIGLGRSPGSDAEPVIHFRSTG